MSNQAIRIPTPSAERSPARSTSFVGHAKLISVLTLCSRILGMLRESVMASYFGATAVAQAFTVAFAIPNLFRKLLGEGALSAAFIPLYAKALKSGDEKEAQKVAAASVNMLATLLIALTLVGELVLWLLPRLIHFRSDNLLVIRFTAIMLPYVILVCGTAFLSGILQVHKRFGLPALTQVPLNLMHVVVIITGGSPSDAQARHSQRTTPDPSRLLALILCTSGRLSPSHDAHPRPAPLRLPPDVGRKLLDPSRPSVAETLPSGGLQRRRSPNLRPSR